MKLSRCFRLFSCAARETLNSLKSFWAAKRGKTFVPEHSFVYVCDFAAWEKAFEILNSEPAVAVDLEANSLHYYPESICLLQFGCPGYHFIVDPAALGDGALLREFFSNPKVEKIFHSCDYDMRSLFRDFQVETKNLFDTAIAAQFLGATHLGLGAVVKEFLGIEISKDKKLQQMNWGLRPLPEEALRYAVNDVAYLIKLAKKQKKLLKAKGRLAWVWEESERMTKLHFKDPVPPSLAFTIVKGWHSLTPKETAIFRELFNFREELALKRHRPPFKVLGGETLLNLARNPETDLEKTHGIGSYFLRHHGKELREVLKKAKELPPLVVVEFKKALPVWRRYAMERMTKLKEWRTNKGAELGLEPSLLWPISGFERLALKPADREQEFKEEREDVRSWQQAAFAAELAALDIWKEKKCKSKKAK